jgi:hypothetical protein
MALRKVRDIPRIRRQSRTKRRKVQSLTSLSLGPIALFKLLDFSQPPLVPFPFGEARSQPDPQNLECEGRANHSSTKAQDVDIIVGDGLASRVRIMAKSCPDSRELVSSHTGTDAAAAHDKASLDSSTENSLTHCLGKVRVIDRVGAVSSKVQYLVPFRRQELEERAFQWKAGVVNAKGNFHGSS